ncbi:MAG: hypothetical protein ABI823_14630 [Bryobacteraceae bacterium]
MTHFDELVRKLRQEPRPEQPAAHLALEIRRDYVLRLRANPKHVLDPVLAHHLGVVRRKTGAENPAD